MTEDLRPRLEAALGSAYRIDKELGGGGMSRVFLAEEVELRRKVVVKVLPPEMAAGVTMRALALAEGRLEEALNQARKIRDKLPNCETCEFFQIARIYDAMGHPDSARVYLEAILAERTLGIRGGVDLPLIYRRLGEIYQAAGDRTKAIEYYTRFVDLWAQADAPLQPKVEEARKRIAKLAGERP